MYEPTLVGQVCVKGAEIFTYCMIENLRDEVKTLLNELNLARFDPIRYSEVQTRLGLVRVQLNQLIDSTHRFGVSPVREHSRPSSQFDSWYSWWYAYAHEEMDNAALITMNEVMDKQGLFDSPLLAQYRPAGSWK